MNVVVKFRRPKPELVSAREVAVGRVYSWGAKNEHYLRVDAGSVNLTTSWFIALTHPHFGKEGPRVQVADAAEVTIGYEE